MVISFQEKKKVHIACKSSPLELVLILALNLSHIQPSPRAHDLQFPGLYVQMTPEYVSPRPAELTGILLLCTRVWHTHVAADYVHKEV